MNSLRILGLFLLFPFALAGQKPAGRFIQDSLRIGQPVQYVLSYRHPVQQDLFFPDESYDFQPFRLIKRDIFDTQTNKLGSLDSVVYTLISLDVTPVQSLQLPIFSRAMDRDCTAIWPGPDSIFLKQLVPYAKPVGIPFQKESHPIQLTYGFNYPALFRGVALLSIVLLIVVGIFGHQIRSLYHLFLFNRRHKEFVAYFRRLAKNHEDTKQVSKILIIWKNHLEWLMKTPVSTFTTQEIYQIIPNERLLDALFELDSTIYGGNKSNQIPFALTILLTVAQEIYREKYISYRHKLHTKR